MAFLQQMALVPGLDQQTPPLAHPQLDSLLITFIKAQNMEKNTINNHQATSLNQQT